MEVGPENNVRRMVIQQLESLRRAGVTHLPRRPAVAVLREAAVAVDAVDTDPGDAYTADPSELAPVRLQTGSLFESAESTSPERNLVIENERSTCSSSQRREKLEALAATVARCTRCRELADARTQTVFGVGNPTAQIVFVGEAPGADEDRLGEPFVGRAGKLLDSIIAACHLKREDLYICNILKCRPPGNRNPSQEEAANCREYLDGQITTVDPDYIVCWGSVAAQNLLETTTSIGKMRGKFYTYGRARVLCTYHPSYLLRNPAAKKQVWEDMKFLMSDMGVELS